MSMRPAPPGLDRLLALSHGVRTVVDVYLGDQLVAGAVPITDGDLTEVGDQNIPESVSFSVPTVDHRTGTSYAGLIACNGHQARLSYIVTRPGSEDEVTIPLGWYLIGSWDVAPDGDAIDVAATGLLTITDENKLQTMTSPPAGAMLSTEFVRLIEGDLPVDVQASADRACPTAMAWQDDRLGAITDLAKAWPAVLEVDTTGTLIVADPPTSATPPDLVLREGKFPDPIIGTGQSGDRANVFNVWVVRGEDSTQGSRPPVAATVVDDRPNSPTFVDVFGKRVAFFASPLITTAAQASATARTLMLQSVAQVAAFPVQLVPDPRIKVNTVVALTRADGSSGVYRVTRNQLPLTAAGGKQTVYLAGM